MGLIKELHTDLDLALDPSCVLYVPLHQKDGTQFTDRSAYGHLCTVIGDLWTPQGRNFDGVDDRIVIPVAASIRNSLALSILAWSRPSVLTGSKVIYSENDAGSNFRLMWTGAQPSFNFHDGTDWRYCTYAVNQSINNFYFLAGTFSATNGMRLYLNGNLVKAAAFYTTGTKTLTGVYLGTEITSNYYIGLLGFVAGFRRELQSAEISRIYETTKWSYR